MTCFRVRGATLIALSVLIAPLALSGQGANPTPTSVPLSADAPFTVAVSTTTIEGGPVYVADNGPQGTGFRVINGGVRNLANGSAHAATNAETQFLIAGTPNVRILFTVAEGLYRIVGKRSAGISRLADLRAKRVTLPRDTSAHYALVRMLSTAGLSESDVKIVDLPRDQMAAGVIDGRADAISMWEPEAQMAVDGLGRDAIVFQDNKVYRELFSLYTTTDVLGDSRRRPQLVSFVRALLSAVDEMKTKPAPHFPLIAKTTGHPVEQIARSWEHHAFPVAVASDMLDVMVEEDKWVAPKQNRAPRSRAALAAFFEPSILDEVRRR
jgi:ABC-type nitrate/sulfonate/bicarbonate transport system substrate-binding protein